MGKVGPTRLRMQGMICAVLLLTPGVARPTAIAAPDAIFARVAAEKLSREFSAPGVSYLLYDMRSQSLIASRWAEADRPVPVGSLVKPFTALAYGESHGFVFPEHECFGGSSCWLPKGHGKLGIVRAVAFSCNSYFEALAAQTGGSQVAAVARRFGLDGPAQEASPEALTGRFGEWRESPRAVVIAYAALLQMREQPAIRDIVDGMAESAKRGTAAKLNTLSGRYLAKTGTAPCIHNPRSTGDGYVLVAWPAELPRYVLLVREHGVPGAMSAGTAARMIHTLEP